MPARIGMLTPSSNTVLEPYTAEILRSFGAEASVHFGRFRVTEISMSKGSQAQFDLGPVLDAAHLLADARVDVIAWNGTSSAWLGLERDLALCQEIEAATGIAATTTMLAYDRLFQAAGVTRIGLVTPYLGEVQERIISNYTRQGIEVVAERHLEDRGNFSFCQYTPDAVADCVRGVAAARPQMIAIVCTNFRGAPVAAALEREFNIPVIDSVAITAWATARLVDLDTARITGWGRLFAEFSSITDLRPTQAFATGVPSGSGPDTSSAGKPASTESAS
ncbi:Asp/Glu/hydantoin racemase [Aurantimonas sp. A2-1-M11]|uniref:maleate cis-trans isomerase family protein n=1 Tax=Aurantimonas sp. A2-1-M11 TaxID=3113712 RepID=UPI002F92BFF0